MAKKSVFSNVKEDTVNLTTKVPRTLKARIDCIQNTLESMSTGQAFNVSAIMAAAISEAVEQAEKELKELGSAQTSPQSSKAPTTAKAPTTEVTA